MDIDHVILGVESVEAAMERMGPVLGAPAFHGSHPEVGSENAIWIPARGPYLEVLGGHTVAEPGTLGLAWRAPDRPALDAAVRRVRDSGFSVGDPTMAWGTSPDGARREWTFAVLPAPGLGGALALVIHHHGWDWRAALAAPTPARRVARVVVEAPDPDGCRARLDAAVGPLPREVDIVEGAGESVRRVELEMADGSLVPFA